MVFKKNSIPWNKGLIYSKKLKNKISKAVRTSPNLYQGKRHHFWKGGITKKYEKLRKSYEYKLWRKSVFERDNYTCVFCKRKKEISGQLEADHIKSFSLFPELRLVTANGRTLCKECHKKTDTYLNKIRWPLS